jgi:hypothetical protein
MQITAQDLGDIGQLIAAIASVATLAYLAVQVRQNTRALRSATYQQISMDMSLGAEAICSHADLSEILVKAEASGLSALSPAEHTRFHYFLVMQFRRLEAVQVQRELGSIDASRASAFERSYQVWLQALVRSGGERVLEHLSAKSSVTTSINNSHREPISRFTRDSDFGRGQVNVQ